MECSRFRMTTMMVTMDWQAGLSDPEPFRNRLPGRKKSGKEQGAHRQYVQGLACK
jgi:hypothetical protein